MLSLMIVYAEQFLHRKSDIVQDDEIQDDAKLYRVEQKGTTFLSRHIFCNVSF